MISARHAYADTLSLRAEKISALQKVDDRDPKNQPYIDAVSAAFDVRTYNIMVANKDLFDEIKESLRSSELYEIESMFAFFVGDIETAQTYYNLAIDRADKDGNKDVKATAYRERGSFQFNAGPKYIGEARDSYMKSLQLLVELKDTRKYTLFLSDWTGWEIAMGDWECGQKLRGIATKLLEEMARTDYAILNQKIRFVQQWDSLSKRDDQPGKGGCAFPIPQI